ncbi:MAG: hypothetical protein ACXWA3_01850, partial [Acidimicrobiales bacterium]
MEQVQQVEGLFEADESTSRAEDIIDLRFDVPVIDLREQRFDLDLDFAVTPEPPGLRSHDVVIDLRDDDAPVVVVGDAEPVLRFGDRAAEADVTGAAPVELSLPTVGMWSRPDRCLPLLVNRARFRQGGVAAVSTERIDLTELAALASRRGDVDARRLARLA